MMSTEKINDARVQEMILQREQVAQNLRGAADALAAIAPVASDYLNGGYPQARKQHLARRETVFTMLDAIEAEMTMLRQSGSLPALGAEPIAA